MCVYTETHTCSASSNLNILYMTYYIVLYYIISSDLFTKMHGDEDHSGHRLKSLFLQQMDTWKERRVVIKPCRNFQCYANNLSMLKYNDMSTKWVSLHSIRYLPYILVHILTIFNEWIPTQTHFSFPMLCKLNLSLLLALIVLSLPHTSLSTLLNHWII